MKKYIIYWDIGCGPEYVEVEAQSEEGARGMAYEGWQEAVDSNCDYGVIGESTERLKED